MNYFVLRIASQLYHAWVVVEERVVRHANFGGIHFRTACDDGEVLGAAVGKCVLQNAFLPGRVMEASTTTSLRISTAEPTSR